MSIGEQEESLNLKKKIYVLLSRIDEFFDSLREVKHKLVERKYNKDQKLSIFYVIFLSFLKIYGYLINILIFVFCYYFYVNVIIFLFKWHLIPRFDSTKEGFTLKFWKIKNWSQPDYKSTFINFAVFHFLFFMALICYSRTIFNNPGYVHPEYRSMYCILSNLKSLFDYIIHNQHENHNEAYDENHLENLIISCQNILANEERIRKEVNNYKHAVFQ